MNLWILTEENAGVIGTKAKELFFVYAFLRIRQIKI